MEPGGLSLGLAIARASYGGRLVAFSVSTHAKWGCQIKSRRAGLLIGMEVKNVNRFLGNCIRCLKDLQLGPNDSFYHEMRNNHTKSILCSLDFEYKISTVKQNCPMRYKLTHNCPIIHE